MYHKKQIIIINNNYYYYYKSTWIIFDRICSFHQQELPWARKANRKAWHNNLLILITQWERDTCKYTRVYNWREETKGKRNEQKCFVEREEEDCEEHQRDVEMNGSEPQRQGQNGLQVIWWRVTEHLAPLEHLLPLRVAGAPPWFICRQRRALHGLVAECKRRKCCFYEGTRKWGAWSK